MGRLLTLGEKKFIKNMLVFTSEINEFLPQLDSILVENMNDGAAMASLKFLSQHTEDSRCLGRTLIQVRFKDDDNHEVLVFLDLDRHDLLFELDVWKPEGIALCHPLDNRYKVEIFN